MIKINNIHIEYDSIILDNEEMELYPSQLTLIKGESGSGKTTLLQRIGLINQDCHIIIDNQELTHTDEIRRTQIGFVLQSNDIIPYLSVEENIRFYASIANIKCEQEDIMNIMKATELDVPLDQNALSLSLGERQRLAIACALVKKPLLLILDEPTASLDDYNKKQIFKLMKRIAETHCYVVFTSHEEEAYDYADRVYEINNKKLVLTKNSIPHCVQVNKHIKPFNKISLIKHYSKMFFHYHKKMFTMITSVILISTVFISFMNSFIYDYHENLKNQLFSQSEQILLINNSNSQYIDDFNQSLQLDAIPFIKMTLQQDSNIYIIPYFKNTHFKDKVETLYSYNHDGIYISYDLQKRLQNVSLTENITLPVKVYATNGIQKSISVDTKINGILKKGVIQNYSKENHQFIYMPYDTMKKIYDDHFDCNSYFGYLKQYDNYDSLQKDNEILSKRGLTTSMIGIDFNQLKDTISVNKDMSIKTNIFLILLILLIMVIVQIYHINRRKKELSLLRINGISSNILSCILLSNNFIGLILSIIVLLFLTFFHVVYVKFVIYALLYILMITILLHFINVLIINRINLENQIRTVTM